jgi:hypothetical protein
MLTRWLATVNRPCIFPDVRILTRVGNYMHCRCIIIVSLVWLASSNSKILWSMASLQHACLISRWASSLLGPGHHSSTVILYPALHFHKYARSTMYRDSKKTKFAKLTLFHCALSLPAVIVAEIAGLLIRFCFMPYGRLILFSHIVVGGLVTFSYSYVCCLLIAGTRRALKFLHLRKK